MKNNLTFKALRGLIFPLLFFAYVFNASAASNVWTGGSSTSGVWSDGTNWSGGTPTSTSDVVIPSSYAGFNPIIDAGATANTVFIQSGKTITVDPGRFVLTVTNGMS